MFPGVILAPTHDSGLELRNALGLKHWHVMTPRMLALMSSPSFTAEPRLLLLFDPGHDLTSNALLQYPDKLVRIFGDRKPDVWHVRKSQ